MCGSAPVAVQLKTKASCVMTLCDADDSDRKHSAPAALCAPPPHSAQLRTQVGRSSSSSLAIFRSHSGFEPSGLCSFVVCPDQVDADELRALLHGVRGGSCAQNRFSLPQTGVMRGAVG